jgi:hypothetical protein
MCIEVKSGVVLHRVEFTTFYSYYASMHGSVLSRLDYGNNVMYRSRGVFGEPRAVPEASYHHKASCLAI